MPGHGMASTISSVARPKHINRRMRLASAVFAFRAMTRPACARMIAASISVTCSTAKNRKPGFSHRGAEVAHRFRGERAERHVEQHAQQQLDVQRNHQHQAPEFGPAGSPRDPR